MSAAPGSGHPIRDYALIGDCQSAALVGPDGSIDWWCAPRFDSRSLFARILDPGGGHWALRPREVRDVRRRYLPDTMVLETTFTCARGEALVVDAMLLGPCERGHGIGHGSPHAIVRLMHGVRGEVHVDVELAPRPEYGLVVPRLVHTEGGVASFGGAGRVVLRTGCPLEVGDGCAGGSLLLREGESESFLLSYDDGAGAPPPAPGEARSALADTVAAWRSWSAGHHRYEGPYADAVRRSALVLQALTHQPTGAVVAAPTTSLPEIPGDGWNWDYRFAWLRDASLTLDALWVAACPDEAHRYFEWMARAAVGAGAAGHVQVVFGVGCERDLTERRLDHLAGHLGSRPVRVGNEAWRQTQLDVYGEVLGAAHRMRERIGDFGPETARMLRALADLAARRWSEPDAGIWEGREGERHYLSSKLMCWVALDRAVRIAPAIAAEERVPEWTAQRDAVRAAVLDRGWNATAGAYTGAFGSDHLDASVLLMPIAGFLPADEPRMRRTIDAVERHLSDGGLVRRWTGAEEGGFVICSFWLADCLARAGEPGRARRVFEAVLAHANDVGLLSEEIDPVTGELLGNHPQAFSHVGLITAAWSIARAEGRG